MTTRLRDRDEIARDLVGVAGLTAVVGGLVLLAPSEELGFDPGLALAGVLSQAATTVPAAAVVLGVAVVELLAGLAIARAVRRGPFASLGDAVLSASVAAVVKDVALLGLLGGFGLFRSPVLWLVDAAVILGAWRLRPLVRRADGAAPWLTVERLGSLPIAALVGLVWVAPIILQLASPVVPFIDVLPNHVAPAEHLRVFGSFSPLTATQSPIYGPSRTLLGYTAVLGTVTTMSGLAAPLVVAAFVLPTTILIGIAAYRLTSVVAGPAAARWSLLVFPLTESFARLADDRATVIVLPVVVWSVSLAARILQRSTATDDGPPAADAWRLPEGVLVGLGLGGAILIHPVIGALAAGTVGVAAIVRPEQLGRAGVTAGVTAAILGLPQLLTMLGIATPALTLAVVIPVAIGAGLGADRGTAVHRPILTLARYAPIAIVPALIVVGVAAGWRIDPDLGGSPLTLLGATAVLLVVGGIGIGVGAAGARSPLVLAGLGLGFAVAIGTQLVPEKGSGLLGEAVRFELPKTLFYWLPVALVVPASAALAWVWAADRLSATAAAGAVGLFVVVAALPVRLEPIDAFHLGEHRYAESLATELHFAGSGFWQGYPDTRLVIDGPRRELVDAVRAEVAAGRVGSDTPVLHVAIDFQQWVATPIGVFAGVTETDATLKTEASIHTVGGRLLPLGALPALLAGRTFPYLLFEPSEDLPPGLPAEIEAAGYGAVFSNPQGTLYRLGSATT